MISKFGISYSFWCHFQEDNILTFGKGNIAIVGTWTMNSGRVKEVALHKTEQIITDSKIERIPKMMVWKHVSPFKSWCHFWYPSSNLKGVVYLTAE